MWRCWVLGFGVMWCCAVMFSEEGLELLTACLQTVGRKIFAAVVPPLNSFHPILLSISSFGETTLHLRIDSWFYQAETSHWWVGWPFGWRFPSLMFLFGIVQLGGLEAAIEHIFSWLVLAANCQTCITWKALHRF